MRRTVMPAILAVVLVLMTVQPAFANLGVGTDTGTIVVGQPLAAGGSYPLQQFNIFNAGDGASGFGMTTNATRKDTLVPERDWIGFAPATFYLAPKENATIHTTLRIPADAEPGVYVVQLMGSPRLAKTKTSGGFLNVGAGPMLKFTVVRATVWQALAFRFDDLMPWSGIAAVLLVVVIAFAAWVVVRRRSVGGPAGTSTAVAEGPGD